MFRTNTIKSFSTRNRKQTKEVPTTKKVVNQNKKKVPIVKVTINDFSLEKDGNIITLTFVPQESVTFLDYDYNNNTESITFDITSNDEYSDIIKNYTGSDQFKVVLDRLTLKQTGNSVDCNFLPLKAGTTNHISKVTFIFKSSESDNETKTIDITSSTVSTLQVVNMASDATLITPIAWDTNTNFNNMLTNITSIVGNYEKLKLTNFRCKEQQPISGNIETNLVVKGTMSGIIGKMKLPITVEDGNLRWQITSVNDIVDTGIPIEGSTETKKIGIDNELALNATTNANDSSIDFRGIELTAEQKTEAYWNNFYVNKVFRYSTQEFQSSFKGYRGTQLVNATEVITTIAPATNASITDNVLTLTFDNVESGFLGETEEINIGTEASPNNVEAVAIYLDANRSIQVRDNINNVNTIKLAVSYMRVIKQTTEPNVNCFVKRTGVTADPTYVVVYYLNASNEYTKYNKQITETSFLQEITNLNVIYGEAIEEEIEGETKKLFVPAEISNVWSGNKLNLETVTPKGINITIGNMKTTNCLYANAKLNLVVQGEMPFEWYESWLPLNKVYVKDDKSVVVNPDTTDGLTQLYSINDLPDSTVNPTIGIKTARPINFDPGNDQGIYSWMDMTRLTNFTSVDNKISNENHVVTFFVNMVKIRDELGDVDNPFYQWNGISSEDSWRVSVQMEYTDLITGFDIEEKTVDETTTKSLVITFKDQITSKFLEPSGDETNKILDISNNENLSKKLSQKLEDLGNTGIGPEVLSLNKLRLINETGDTFFTNFYTSKLQSIEIRYLKYENDTTNGIANSYVINTADSNKKIINRVINLLVIQGTITDNTASLGPDLLEPINALQTGSGDSLIKGVFEEETKKVHLDIAKINDQNSDDTNSIYNDKVIPEVKAIKGVNILVSNSTTNIVVKGEIPSWIYNCLDTTNGAGQLNLNTNSDVIEPTIEQNKKKPRKADTVMAIIDGINQFPDDDIGINNTSGDNQNNMDLSEQTLSISDPKLTNIFLDNVTVSASTTNDVQMQFTRHVGLQSEGSNITIKQVQCGDGDGVKAPVDDPLVPLISGEYISANSITFYIKPNNKGTLLVPNRVNYGSTDVNNPEQPSNIVIDLTDNKNLSKGMKNWQGTEGTTITFSQDAVILQKNWSDSQNPTNPDIRLNGDQTIETITIKWYDEGDAEANPVVEPSYKSVTFRKTPIEGSDEKEFKDLTSIINKLYLVNGGARLNSTDSYQAVDITENNTTIKGIFKKTDEDNPVYSIEGVPELTLDTITTTSAAGRVILYNENIFPSSSEDTTTSIINKYYITNMILKGKSNSIFNNLLVKGDIPRWAFEQFNDSNMGYSLIQQEENYDKWTITRSIDTNAQANIIYVNALPVSGYEYRFNIGVGDALSSIGKDELIGLSGNSLKRNNFHVSTVYVKDNIEKAYVQMTSAYSLEYKGSEIIINGVARGTLSNVTEEIKNFTLKTEGTGETQTNTLIVTFKPNVRRHILAPYRELESPTNILLDVTGNLELCSQLKELKTKQNINKIIIRQEALIVKTSDNNINIKMNDSYDVQKITIKFFDVVSGKSTGEIYETSSTTITYEISNLYFIYGTISNHLLTPLSSDNVFIKLSGDEVGNRTFKINGMKQLKTNLESVQNTEVNLKCEEGCLKDVYTTNIINAITKSQDSEDKRNTNIVVYGEIPYEIYRDFQFSIDDQGTIYPSNVQHSRKDDNSIKYPITTINDFPCSGYGEDLDIGIGIKPQNEGEEYPVSILKIPESVIPNNNNSEPIKFEKEGFYVDDVDFGEIKKKTEELQIMFTSHRGFRTIGSKIKIKPKIEGDGDNNGDGTSVMKVKSLNDLYNMMMEPRKYKSGEGILRSINGNLIQIPDEQILADGNHLYYLKTKVKGKERLILSTVTQVPTDYVPVYVIGDKGLTNQEGVTDGVIMIRLILAIEGTIMDNDFSMQNNSNVMYMKNINYGVVGNGAFEGSSIESIEVKGNKFNLKIEDIMNSICIRTLDEDTMEKSIKDKTEDSKKTKKIEMTKYIQYMRRVFQTMAYNKRYINEVLGYLSKCVSFEKTRLPSIREDNQGLESISSEWSETNSNGWIEKFTEDFTQGGINYKVVSGYEYNYKFRNEGKHADLIKNMEDKLKGIYMFSLMERMSETDNEGTADNEYALMRMIDELIVVWLEYYKGVVTPDDNLLDQYSEIEIYEDEQVYKIFEATEEGETKVITCLTGGNEDEQSLETFIQGILEFFKDEIKTIVGRKEDINGFDIEEFVAYEDPMKGKTEDMISESELNKIFQEDDNNLIEYSQMLSTIQGERNKLQRQGNKNKFILKFTQTYKGTFFELLGKETKNTDDDSIILGFFMSELKNIVSHERKRGKGYIPDKTDNKRFVRITKVPEFYKGDPLDWINDNYYCNKIFTQNCDNLYLGLQPEIANRITVKGTPDEEDSNEFKEKDMIGYYMVKVK